MNDSNVFGVSVRAWGMLIALSTICAMSMLGLRVGEPLATLSGIMVGFYYGRSTGKQEQKISKADKTAL